jgi:aerobic-type carbon monoxide dehydrogenase small subunit (CoxS/CutS family)
MAKMTLTVNDKRQEVDVAPSTPLLYVLRDDLKLNGPKFGCGLAQCGACTVIVNGVAVRSCVTAVNQVKGNIRTLEGIGSEKSPHPVQRAFIEEQAAACGYCTNGWVMNAVALLERNPRASEQQIRDQLAGVKCRCGTHMSILRAIRKAGRAMA